MYIYTMYIYIVLLYEPDLGEWGGHGNLWNVIAQAEVWVAWVPHLCLVSEVGTAF